MFFNNTIANFAQPTAATSQYARNIVTSGLTLYLDASEATSYPGSGATWSDLSGNGYNFTLFNTWGFGGTGTNKYLVSNGSNNYGVNTSATLVALGTSPEFTIQCILERTSGANDQDFYSTQAIGTAGSTLVMSFANQLRGHLWATGATNVLDSGTSFGSSKRAFTYQLQWSGNIMRDVYDGTVQSTSTLGGSRPTSTTAPATNLASRDGSGAFFGGNWYGILVYTRYLSTTELQQNATAFGL